MFLTSVSTCRRGSAVWRNAVVLVGTLIVFVTAPAVLHAQITVSGAVYDQDGQPLMGAEVVIVASDAPIIGRPSASRTIGVGTTGADGTYTITVPAARYQVGQLVQLVVRRIGYRSTSTGFSLTGGQQEVDFTLNQDVLMLDEIVVTGQGLEQVNRKLGVSISSIRGQDLVEAGATNVIATLAGRAPNIEVTSSSGDPGAGAYIRIRGANTIQGGTQPLFVIDGQPIINRTTSVEGTTAGVAVQNRAADINPNDIENIEILKGAAASAIYGSRAANGVVLITTKSGQRGQTQFSVKSGYTFNQVTNLPGLQTRYGQGMDQTVVGGTGVTVSSVTWGAELPAGATTYDHAGELFTTGHNFENQMTLSGGSDRTTYLLSLAHVDQQGTIKGNSAFKRTNVRLKGTHDLLENLRVGGNVAFSTSAADLVQQGSNISGMLLGALRTPPEFNNLPYIDPATGLHRSYRCETGVQGSSCPTTLAQGRGYDNPFWITNELINGADVNRTFGNINLEYTPLDWLKVNYLIGLDFSSDERITQFPKSSSDFPDGRLIRAEIQSKAIDHSLLATATGDLSPDIGVSFTLGQNLNQEEFTRFQVNGFNLIFGTDQLDFTVTKTPNEYTSRVRTEGYFTQASVDFKDQLFLTGALRYDGSNTFGGEVDPTTGEKESSRFWYPKVSGSWEFGQHVTGLDFGKVRAAWGRAGKQPGVFTNVSSFNKTIITDGWLSPNGLETIYGGLEGVVSQGTLGNTAIVPEETREFEVGGDIALIDSRLAVAATRYEQRTKNVILQVPLAPSTGYSAINDNGAEFTNKGWEFTLDLRPIQMRDISWDLNAQWARNSSMVVSLPGAEEVGLSGFSGSTSSLVAGHPFGVLYGDDFVRFGRGIIEDGVNIDAAYTADSGTIYIGPDGFPRMDAQERVAGDPNPDWTGSLRSTFTLFGKVRVSGLVDVKRGGDMWNGTKGALVYFGTHESTEIWHGAGVDTVFAGAGPGAGQTVRLDWSSWGPGGGLGTGFTGPFSQFIEDAGYVKLRDISVAFTVDADFMRTIGFNDAVITLSARNLKTWTDYTGIDPESNLTSQSNGRGIDYFGHPQTRSFAFSVTLNR